MEDNKGVEEKEKEEKKEKKKTKLIVSVITVLIICIIGGGIWRINFVNSKNKITHNKEKPKNKSNYSDLFIIYWNKIVIKQNYGEKFLLPSDIKKARIILKNLTSLKIINKKIGDLETLKNNVKFNYLKIPLNAYETFIIKNKNYFINFYKQKALKYSQIHFKDIKKIVYLNNFKEFFEDHKQDFYKKGFSLNIKNYNEFIIALKKSIPNNENLKKTLESF